MVRRILTREKNEAGEKEWKKKHGYGVRWEVESAISDYKRMFGESIPSKSFPEMVREISRNIEYYNAMKKVTTQ